MKKELIALIKEHRDRLLREAKQSKPEDYKAGFADGILDMYNKSINIIETHITE